MKHNTQSVRQSFKVLTNKESKVKIKVIETSDKTACVPSFVGKHISLFTQTSSRFYHRSVRELRMEEENRSMKFAY
jgi:hypothetical protein